MNQRQFPWVWVPKDKIGHLPKTHHLPPPPVHDHQNHPSVLHVLPIVSFVPRCPDPSSRAALKLVCDLYALDRIWNDIGTYRNVDYVAPNKAKAIHKLSEYLSFQVRNIAGELIDAFDLPDHVTRAPIAMQSEAYAQYTQHVGF
ncbi:hypothetical protein Patl1_27247 [Pistacia atlantica]|uniref:Uncharacterized protein n=1 Tax=Pistacia atlantica TaxID=434234 RepID=A0ACC1BDX8_9ROSI|nr:hypothetical protein Patl1_27247 [Pistacia atlantica]